MDALGLGLDVAVVLLASVYQASKTCGKVRRQLNVSESEEDRNGKLEVVAEAPPVRVNYLS